MWPFRAIHIWDVARSRIVTCHSKKARIILWLISIGGKLCNVRENGAKNSWENCEHIVCFWHIQHGKLATKMFRRYGHSHSFICIDRYLSPIYLMLMICTSYCGISNGCYQRSSKEKESWDVHFHKLFLCLFTSNVADKLTTSQLVIHIRSSFSGRVRLEG